MGYYGAEQEYFHTQEAVLQAERDSEEWTDTYLLKMWVEIGEHEGYRFYLLNAEEKQASYKADLIAFTYFGSTEEDYKSHLNRSFSEKVDYFDSQSNYAEASQVTRLSNKDRDYAEKFGIAYIGED